jgi:hypothetical protein
MEYTEKEMELARAYNRGHYNDVQFNYLVVQNRLDKKRMEELLESLGYNEPMAVIAKFVILCMMLHFGVCFFYSVATIWLPNLPKI